MVDKKFIVAAIGVIVALGAVGPSLAQMFQHAEAHGVQAQLQSRFVRIDGETWSKQSVHTGDTLTVSGKFVRDRKSTRLNSSHPSISYAVFCLKQKILLAFFIIAHPLIFTTAR